MLGIVLSFKKKKPPCFITIKELKQINDCVIANNMFKKMEN